MAASKKSEYASDEKKMTCSSCGKGFVAQKKTKLPVGAVCPDCQNRVQ
ncbi:MAG: hypothetical protein PHH26_02985 [Candidatus Thermoplasmatota archaeon]|nr:hypothetical protein [Candidatus Thermoplasmatota archaeon]